jgi:hypothetical protein
MPPHELAMTVAFALGCAAGGADCLSRRLLLAVRFGVCTIAGRETTFDFVFGCAFAATAAATCFFS